MLPGALPWTCGRCAGLSLQLALELPHGTDERLLKILQFDVAGVHRDEDQIKTAGQIVPAETKRLAEQALQPVAKHGIAVLSGDAQTDARSVVLAGGGEDRQMRTADDTAQGVNAGEIRSLAQMLVFAKAQTTHGQCSQNER